jgi:hypothetical protein
LPHDAGEHREGVLIYGGCCLLATFGAQHPRLVYQQVPQHPLLRLAAVNELLFGLDRVRDNRLGLLGSSGSMSLSNETDDAPRASARTPAASHHQDPVRLHHFSGRRPDLPR